MDILIDVEEMERGADVKGAVSADGGANFLKVFVYQLPDETSLADGVEVLIRAHQATESLETRTIK